MQNSKVVRSFEITCNAGEIPPLLKKVFLELNKFNAFIEEIEFNLEIAAREMLANAIEHGCALAAENSVASKNLKIKIELEISKKQLIFEVEDPGPGFDWKNYDLDTMPEFDEKGRGLKMINQVSDQIKFNSSGNKITAIFKFSG